MNCKKFLIHQLRGADSVEGRILPFPIYKPSRCYHGARTTTQTVMCFFLRWRNTKCNALIWRPSIRPSACPIFNLNRARGAHLTWLTRGQQATRPAYISIWVLRGQTYLLIIFFSSSSQRSCLDVYTLLRNLLHSHLILDPVFWDYVVFIWYEFTLGSLIFCNFPHAEAYTSGNWRTTTLYRHHTFCNNCVTTAKSCLCPVDCIACISVTRERILQIGTGMGRVLSGWTTWDV